MEMPPKGKLAANEIEELEPGTPVVVSNLASRTAKQMTSASAPSPAKSTCMICTPRSCINSAAITKNSPGVTSAAITDSPMSMEPS